jgi:endonuclease/exonuclease/phosphatase family metal-dependent hydrolase
LVLGNIDANFEAQPLKVLVVGDLNFQAGSELKDENSNQTQRELLEKADAYIDTTMCVDRSADDKVLKDTMPEEVQRIELPEHNLAVSGGDMNREPPLASAILGMTHQEHSEDWEVVAELPTPKKLLFLKL